MTNEEKISALKDEVKNLKSELETERKKSAELVVNLSHEKDAVKQLEAEVTELKKAIEDLASAEPAPAAQSIAAAGLEFKHEDALYLLDEHPDRDLIIPAIGRMKASEAVVHPEAVAYLVKNEIATKL